MQTKAHRRDRQQLDILSLDECLAAIDASPIGRVGFTVDGQPFILPVNHLRDGMRVAFRTASGAKLDAARAASLVAFEVDGHDLDTRSGWSVLAVGTATLADEIMTSHLEARALEPWANGIGRDRWIVVQLRNVSGRRIAVEREPATTTDTESPDRQEST